MGTPRSGTTLVQRVACELAGVVVPPETHFLSRFAAHLDRRRFPLRDTELRAAVERYAELTLVPIDPVDVVDRLRGSANDLFEVFGAVVRSLAGDGAAVTGEKTPAHLLWWRPLTLRFPDLAVVLVTRDPRAVAASLREVPWSEDHLGVAAERWRRDQAVLARARTELGSRALLLRYEDVVADADGARAALAGLLGVHPHARTSPDPAALHRADEPWKRRASAPIDAGRADRWQTVLTAADDHLVQAVCRRPMTALGYPVEVRTGGLARWWLRSPADQLRRLRWARRRRAVERRAARG